MLLQSSQWKHSSTIKTLFQKFRSKMLSINWVVICQLQFMSRLIKTGLRPSFLHCCEKFYIYTSPQGKAILTYSSCGDGFVILYSTFSADKSLWTTYNMDSSDKHLLVLLCSDMFCQSYLIQMFRSVSYKNLCFSYWCAILCVFSIFDRKLSWAAAY